MAQQDASTVHRLLLEKYGDVLEGRLDDALQLIDPDVVDHRGGSAGDHHGIDAWRKKWEGFATGEAGFHDVSVVVQQNVASQDTSVNRYLSSGTQTATGRSYAVALMDMIKVRDGRVIEHWAIQDQDAVRHQLSVD